MNVANILNAFHYLYVIYDTDEESLCSEQCSWRPQTPGQGRYTYLGFKKKKKIEASTLFHNTFHCELYYVMMLIKKIFFDFFFASVKGGGDYLLNTGFPM